MRIFMPLFFTCHCEEVISTDEAIPLFSLVCLQAFQLAGVEIASAAPHNDRRQLRGE